MKHVRIALAVTVALFWLSSLLFDITGFAAFGLLFIAYWAFLILLLLVVLSSLIPAWRRSSRRIPLRSLLIPLGMAGVAVVSLLLNALNTAPALTTSGNPSEELAYMAATDQADRYALAPFFLMPDRDVNRVNRVLEILDSDASLTAEDQYNAALILQHGSEPVHYETAYQLALAADEAGQPNELWKLAYDRWQISIGNEQVYGTQSSVTLGPGVFRIDEP